ncbi:hypothetical protein D7Y13_22305 [Corallococcus praedator]|uniref:Fatty acid desaturase domain-containing protein n=1 Tax=Corallococcus praedator TaxID=2316724 RepID=A0ABX9QG17_9BACT|nr:MULTISPECIES: hypothetical protein [Corallococcus]RKH03533.1 hypothetical protein D7X74_36140 [Corallococcus sp. CA047B]RKH26011.1 hypothetical protein D7X75_29090 [Corallococcus sp. CA031C]RKI03324.1 hypothetical protein D7Y13_22305 [Corallococcus praedator]
MIGIPLGWAYSNFAEWALRRYVTPGRRHPPAPPHASFAASPCADAYLRSLWTRAKELRERMGLTVLALAHMPLFPVAPFFVGTVWACAFNFHRVHRRAHLDPTWARANVPWLCDHHLGRVADANWCVTHPFFDQVLGTRHEHLGIQPAAPVPALS